MNDLSLALEPLAVVCQRFGLRLQIGGSVATSVYGVARTTLDVDVVIDLPPMLIDRFVAALEPEYMIENGAVRDAVDNRSSFNLIHQDTVVKIDVFIPPREGFARETFSRGVEDTLEDGDDARRFVFATPEDMILHKLVWYELGERVSERQWDDVRGVVGVLRNSLDWDYLEHWADMLNVGDLLNLLEART